MATRYVALLRGINSGRNPVTKMDALKAVFEACGMRNVKTLLNSGNVIFDADRTNESALIRKLEPPLTKGLRYNVSAIIRTHEQIATLVKAQPFKKASLTEMSRPNVTFLKVAPDKATITALGDGGAGYRIARVFEREICSVVDMSSASTPDLMRVLEKALGKEITTRTWNTVERVLRACDA